MGETVRIKATVPKVPTSRDGPTSKVHQPRRHTRAMGTNRLIGVDKGFEASGLVVLLRNLWIRKSFCRDLFCFPSSVRRLKQAESVKLLLEAELQEIKKNLTEA